MVFASLISDLFEFIQGKWSQERGDGTGTGIGASRKSGRGVANVYDYAGSCAEVNATGKQY
jgi:hypothetical protein